MWNCNVFYHFKVGHSCHDALFHKSQIKFGSSLSKIAKRLQKRISVGIHLYKQGIAVVLGVTKSFQSHLTFVAPAVPTEGKLLVDNKLKQHLFYSSSMSCSVLVYYTSYYSWHQNDFFIYSYKSDKVNKLCFAQWNRSKQYSTMPISLLHWLLPYCDNNHRVMNNFCYHF